MAWTAVVHAEKTLNMTDLYSYGDSLKSCLAAFECETQKGSILAYV
jgi:hypothetical protein